METCSHSAHTHVIVYRIRYAWHNIRISAIMFMCSVYVFGIPIDILDPAPILSVFQNESYCHITSRCPPATHLHCVRVRVHGMCLCIFEHSIVNRSLTNFVFMAHGLIDSDSLEYRIVFRIFFLFTFHIFLFLSATMTTVTRRTQNMTPTFSTRHRIWLN